MSRELNGVRTAWDAIAEDLDFLRPRNAAKTKRRRLLILLFNPSIQFAFLARIASLGGAAGRIARLLLLRNFSSDVSPGALIRGGLYVPHPLGIVIGKGTILEQQVTLYQNVTLGAGKDGKYPLVERGTRIFPNAIVVGGVRIGEDSTIGAASFCDYSVLPRSVIRRTRPMGREE